MGFRKIGVCKSLRVELGGGNVVGREEGINASMIGIAARGDLIVEQFLVVGAGIKRRPTWHPREPVQEMARWRCATGKGWGDLEYPQ